MIMINGIENNMEKKQRKKLSLEQISAIVIARRIGRKIASDYPEIADDYRRGNTINEIEENYNFREKYNGSNSVIQNSIKKALEILISNEERENLKRQHLQKSCQRNYERGIGIFSLSSENLKEIGRKSYEKKKGIHAQNKEELKKNAIKAGRRLYEMGIGIHALSTEERKELSKKGVIARGHKPFSDEERTYFYELCKNPKYQYEIGRNKGKLDYKLISEELERRSGIKRSILTLKDIIYRPRVGTK